MPDAKSTSLIPPLKPAAHAERQLLAAILNGEYPVESTLPGERELAQQLGVTRPTLREALQRLAREGWVEIQQGKPTRVRNYWEEGNLAMVATLSHPSSPRSADFVRAILETRVMLAPTYVRQALERAPQAIAELLASYADLPDDPLSFAEADWKLHEFVARKTSNPVFPLIMNSFSGLAITVGARYFARPEYREQSRVFYRELQRLAEAPHPASEANLAKAEALTRRVMQTAVAQWIQFGPL